MDDLAVFLNKFLWLLCILEKWIHQHLILSQDPTYAVATAVSCRLFFEMLQTLRNCGCREPHLWPAACSLPSLQSDVLLLSCRAVERRTGQGQGHSWCWGAAVRGGGSACLHFLQKMHLHLLHLPCFGWVWSVLRWFCLLCHSLTVLGPKSCCRVVGKLSAFHTLAPFPADVSISGYTAQYSSIPTLTIQQDKPQNGRERWRAGWLFLLNPYWKSQAN